MLSCIGIEDLAYDKQASQEGIGAVVMTDEANGSGILRDILTETTGGEYPAITWLERTYR